MDLTLTAADGHSLHAYLSEPAGAAKGGLVVIQEIFGVNDHIRSVTDAYAREGYVALAPALFDRVRPGIELGYESDDVANGRAIRAEVAFDDAMHDVTAAVTELTGRGLKTATIGYCWGGSLAWAAATRIVGLAASVSYYGGQVPDMADETPNCPIILHFGETDASIPMNKVDAFRAKHADLPVHIYPAGHGFSCDARAAYDAESAALAKERSLAFLSQHM